MKLIQRAISILLYCILLQKNISIMADCLLHIATNLRPIFSYSARYFERMGQYHECIADTKMNYNFVMLTVQDQQANAGFIGLCLPKQCKTQEIEAVFNGLFKVSKLPLIVSNIQNDVPNIRHEFSWVFFLTFIIVISCIVLTIYASLSKPANHLSAFSIQQSRKLFKLNPKSNLNILNGVRSISMMWVIIGHMYGNMLINALNIQSSVEKNSFEKPFFLFIEGGIFAVDVFFFIAGLLLAHVFLRDSSKLLVKYPLAIVQRMLRLWPSYIFTILIYYSVYVHLGSGPFWGQDQIYTSACGEMWKPIFFVDNLVDNGEKQCMNWGWYLQNDMQLFTFSIILLYVYRLKPILMKVIVWPLMFGSMVFSFMWTFNHKTILITHISDAQQQGNYFADVYSKPWARCSPYFLGLFFGILHFQYELSKKDTSPQNLIITQKLFLFKVSEFFRKKKIIRNIFEWSGVLVMLFLVLIPRTLQVGIQWPQWLHSLYQSVSSSAFVLGLYLTLLPSLLGFGQSIINFCLDTKFFNFIAKISFCTYLIHYILIQIWVNSRTYSQYYTNMSNWPVFCGVLIVSMACGLLMTLMIEAPFSKLQKIFINYLKTSMTESIKAKTKSQNQKNQDNNLSETLLTQDSSRNEQKK